MKQTEVNVNSPIFEEFICNLNTAILKCLSEMHADNFSGGDISAKISIEVERACELFPAGLDENGREKTKAYHYKKPAIEHKVTLTLKKREEAKGSYSEDLELKQDDERFILSEVRRAQMTLEEMGGVDHAND